MQASDVIAGETPISANAAMMDLCAHLFREPQRLVKAHTFTTIGHLTNRRQQGPHSHENILQLDFALGCNGRWIVDGRSYAARGDTLAVFYPHEVHSYELFGDNEYARVLSIKFHIESDWAAVRQRVFMAHLPALERSDALIHNWDRLIRLSAWNALHPHQTQEPLAIAHLCEVLCRFPTEDNHLRPSVGSADSVMEEALLFLERRLQRPPHLEELAADVHLSPRQLSRRFLAATGQTPQQYVNGLRLLMARDLLEEHTPVSEVARHLNFSSVQAFSRWFKNQNGTAPRAIRRSRIKPPSI
jgi:AraC-like DNA-binding protein